MCAAFDNLASIHHPNQIRQQIRGRPRACSPLIGGFLNDAVSPRSIWIGGLAIGLTSVLGLSLLAHQEMKRQSAPLPVGPLA